MLRIVIVLVFVGLCVHTAAALSGSGTPQDPWRIESLADFDEFAADPNYWSGFTRLETDVNLAGRTYSTAVIAPDTNNANDWWEFDGTAFTGVFDGNEHKIIGLTIDGGAGNEFLGLFGCIAEEGEVKNLGLEGGSISGEGAVGGLVGEIGYWEHPAAISNCHFTGDVSGTGYSVGGLVGENWGGTISNCYSVGDVNGVGGVGGLVGWLNGGSISNCHSTGDVWGSYEVGGLVGENWGGTISNCYSTGDVNGTGWGTGGLVGGNVGSISNCYSTGDVNGVEDVGGLVGPNGWTSHRGSAPGYIFNSYSTGSVNGTVGSVGGLVGSSFGIISNCYSTGDVNGVEDVGGLVGHNGFPGIFDGPFPGHIFISYSTGSVQGASNVGGLVGYNLCGDIEKSFWNVQTSGEPNMCGGQSGIATGCNPNCGKTTAQMQTKSTFTEAGWDFIEIWGIGENQTYPYLRFVPAGDFNYDKEVNFLDLAILASNWLEDGK